MTKTDEYIRIVIEGYGDPVSRKYLCDYFVTVFKKKEQDSFVGANIFFDNCLRIVIGLRENIDERYRRRKQELIDILAGTKAEFETSNGEELKKEMKQQKYNVDSFDISEVQVSWSNITEGNYSAPSLYMKDLLIIENAINEAKEIVVPDDVKENKLYDSYYRAVAIYFVLLYKNKSEEIPESKEVVKKLVQDWKHPNGKKFGPDYFYQVLKTGVNNHKAIYALDIERLKREYELDYKYALNIFKNKQKLDFV